MSRLPENIIVVSDEAYLEFSIITLDAPNTFAKIGTPWFSAPSKIHGLAGLRIGYGVAPLPLIAVLDKTRQPLQRQFHRACRALAAFKDEAHQRETACR
jgi:histidinol-phosphate aminotransferase